MNKTNKESFIKKLNNMTEEQLELKLMEYFTFRPTNISELILICKDIEVSHYYNLQMHLLNLMKLDVDEFYWSVIFYLKASEIIKTWTRYTITVKDTRKMFDTFKFKENMIEYRSLLSSIEYLEEKKLELQKIDIHNMISNYKKIFQTKKVIDYIKKFPF